MAEAKLESDFDRYLSLSEKEHRTASVAANDAFIAAMKKQIGRGREKVKAGTFVDQSPAISARRMYGEVLMSSCGSPAAMCLESGGSQAGAETMK